MMNTNDGIPGRTFAVYQIDDEGTRVIIDDASTPEEAARRAANLDPTIHEQTLARTWNATNAYGDTRYEIGETSPANVNFDYGTCPGNL